MCVRIAGSEGLRRLFIYRLRIILPPTYRGYVHELVLTRVNITKDVCAVPALLYCHTAQYHSFAA
jgi:hypothetical protein